MLVGFLQQKRAFKDDEDEDTDGSEEEEERNVKGKKKPKFEKDEQGNIIICEVCINFWLFIFFSIQPLSTHTFASGPFLYQITNQFVPGIWRGVSCLWKIMNKSKLTDRFLPWVDI